MESWFPGSVFYEDIREFGEKDIMEIARLHSNVGSYHWCGPPCQGVSGLNVDNGLDPCSRSVNMPWAQVHRLMESVASMSPNRAVCQRSGLSGGLLRSDLVPSAQALLGVLGSS